MLRGLAVVIALSACHATESERAGALPSAPTLKTLRVSANELVVTAERGAARATIEIEHFPPQPPDPSAGYLPGEDLGVPYVYMLLDRRAQVISMGGISRIHPERWLALMKAERSRTAQELNEDLQVAIDAVQMLQAEPRGTRDYQRELSDMSRTAKDLQGVRAPADSIDCATMVPPTCDQR